MHCVYMFLYVIVGLYTLCIHVFVCNSRPICIRLTHSSKAHLHVKCECKMNARRTVAEHSPRICVALVGRLGECFVSIRRISLKRSLSIR